MIKGVLLLLFSLVLVVAAAAGFFLRQAHEQIDALNPEFPPWDVIRQSRRDLAVSTLATSIEARLTASQMIPVSRVLEGIETDASYRMSFPVFVITWPDGKQFVIDAGLTQEGAAAFGKPSEYIGAEPMQFEAGLGDLIEVDRVEGIGFSHLHEDHMGGLADLCATKSARLVQVVQTFEQYSRTNYGTQGGNEAIDNLSCGQRLIIKDPSLLKPVRGFTGLFVIYGAGHTPGSQVFVVHIREGLTTKTYLLSGDLVNHIDGIRNNLPKPGWYSRFIVPENLSQLDKGRRWLKAMMQEENVHLLVSHDLVQIRSELSLIDHTSSL